MATIQEPYSNETNIRESDNSEATGGELITSATFTKSRTLHNDITPSSSSSIDNYLYTTTKKPGSAHAKVLFSEDYDTADEATSYDFADSEATWKNANGDILKYGGYSFDGTNDQVDLTSAISFGTTNFTITGWVYSTGAGRDVIIASRTTGAASFIVGVNGSSGYIEGFISDTSANSSSNLISPVKLITNKWNHYAVVINRSTNTAYSYLNGESTSYDISGVTGNINSTGIPRIGRNQGVLAGIWEPGWFAGRLSEMRIYTEALSSTDIWNLISDGSTFDDANLIHRFNMAGNFNDSVGSNNGTVTGATSIPVATHEDLPIIGQAISGDETNGYKTKSFDGTNDYVSIGTLGWTGYSNCSIECWIYPVVQPTVGSFPQGWAFTSVYSGTDDVSIYVNPNGSISTAWDDGTRVTVSSSAAASWAAFANRWYHVMAVQKNSTNTLELFVDGVSVGTTSYNHNFASHSGVSYIGNRQNGTDKSYFGGYISNVGVYDAALTVTDALAHYKAGYPTNQTDLVNHWILGNDYNDGVGSNNGTNNGSTETNVIDRPFGTLAPAQQTIDLSSLSFTDTLYIKNLFSSQDVDITYGLGEYTIEYTEGGRRIILVRRY